MKATGKRVDESQKVILDETYQEFQNIKAQFEAFGKDIYERISNEMARDIQVGQVDVM